MDNRQWRLARPALAGERVNRSHFVFGSVPTPALEPGQILVRTLLLSCSPAQRGYISAVRSMHAKLEVGDVMRGRGIGVVCESQHSGYPVGTIVNGSLGWQDYALLAPDTVAGGIFLVQTIRDPVTPLTRHLGVLGSTGATAYFGLLDVGALARGDTVVVSAAAGGVGSIAGQIARICGARVIGIAGGPEKCHWLTAELGFDGAIDYRSENVAARLAELCPAGIDVYFDNVGGAILDAALDRLAVGARVVICGFISTDGDELAPGPRNYKNLVRRRARMQGFFVFDYLPRMGEAESQLRAWYESGQLLPTEHEIRGLERMPDVLDSLFTGQNLGVALCRVSD
jgi:NADPH-dependent curcumin reductase CurA